MLFFKKLVLSLVCIHCSLAASAAANDVFAYLDRNKHDPHALYAFFKAMPKGGELHYHLTGGAYPEIMLAIAAKGDYCFMRDTWRIAKTTTKCDGVSSKELINNSVLYEQALRAWSMKDFNFYGSETAHDHFFATFLKFGLLTDDHYPELLIDIIKRAAEQHEYYLEIMVMPVVPSLNKLLNYDNNDKPLKVKNFAKLRNQLLADPVFQAAVNETSQKIDNDLTIAHKMLGCDASSQSKACQLTIKFQYYALRAQPLEKVFMQLLLGFLVAEKNQNVVGVNIVQEENAFISLRDYKKQMQIFKFLHKIYPDVAIALHAGELNPQSVMPKDMRFHIHDAIYTGHAKRIGHGVSIAHENNSQETMRFMKTHHIAVEINLMSSAIILNVKGTQHPLNYYLQHQVPVVLSSDDEGVLRTDLTSQYVEAVLTHGLNYQTIKQINRNALSYSFLPGKSLWRHLRNAERVAACADLMSESCLQFVKQNEKAKLQRQLEIALNRFEKQY